MEIDHKTPDPIINRRENMPPIMHEKPLRESAIELSKALAEMTKRAIAAENAIRKHRDQRGDDRCWMDDEELYRILPEGYEPPIRDSAVELRNCQRFIDCRSNPSTEYVSPQRRIEELERELSLAKRRLLKTL